MENREQKFVVCIKNDDCDDLVLRKIYQVIPDKEGEKDGYLRILDESGGDYLYPESYFIFVRLPRKAQQAMVISK